MRPGIPRGLITVLAAALAGCGARTGLNVGAAPLDAAVAAVDASDVPRSMCDWPAAMGVVQLTDGPGDHFVGDAVAVGGRVLLAWISVAAGADVHTQWIGPLGERLGQPPNVVQTLSGGLWVSIAADGTAPRGLLSSDGGGWCEFTSLASDGSAAGSPLTVATASSCSTLHMRPSGDFDTLFVASFVHRDVDLGVIMAGGLIGSTSMLGVTNPPIPVRAFASDGSFVVAGGTDTQVTARRFDASGAPIGPAQTLGTRFGTPVIALVATPQGYVVAWQTQPSSPPSWPLVTASLTPDGVLRGTPQPLGAAYATNDVGETSFDLAYADGDVLMAEVAVVAGVRQLNFVTMTLDGVPRALPVRLTSARVLTTPRIVTTTAGVVVVFDATASDGTTQVFSIGLNCLR